jgi:NitT/TauT family transport system ATP-binding protein
MPASPSAPGPGPLASQPAISLHAVTKAYRDGVAALGPIDLAVRRGEFVSLLGPSGCGKSTALRLIARLAAPSSGRVDIAAGAARGRGEHPIGFVFQESTLMPWTSVRGNVGLPLALAHVPEPQIARRVDEALARVDLADFADAYPRELSGGMKMRVSLARALVTGPDILLMDEPFAALDEITRFRLNDDLLALWRELGMTVLFVTHSVFESVYLSQRVLVMTPRPGRIAAEFSIDAPATRGEEFRTSADYAAHCRAVSRALAETGAAGPRTAMARA